MEIGQFKEKFTKKTGILVGCGCQFFILPFIGFCSTKIFDLPPVRRPPLGCPPTANERPSTPPPRPPDDGGGTRHISKVRPAARHMAAGGGAGADGDDELAGRRILQHVLLTLQCRPRAQRRHDHGKRASAQTPQGPSAYPVASQRF